MTKKFKLTTDTKMWFGHKLFRIQALIDFGNVKAGELGGYVEKEDNLSHYGNAWVYENARVCGNALVHENAVVCGSALVHENAVVCGSARVCGDAVVCGSARVCGNAWVCGSARVCGNALVHENAVVRGDAWVCGDALVCESADYLCIKGLGSLNRNTTFYKTKDNDIGVVCGCFSGMLDEFVAKVKDRHGDTKYAKEYLAAVEVVKIHFDKEDHNG